MPDHPPVVLTPYEILASAIENQLKLQVFYHDCRCCSCEVLKPLAYALANAKEAQSQADYREFCKSSQAAGGAQGGTESVAQGPGVLAHDN